MNKLVTFLLLALVCLGHPPTVRAADTDIHLWLPPIWKTEREKAIKIALAFSQKSGLKIVPRIANTYPEIMRAFAGEGLELAYVGSMVQAVIIARKLGTPLFQVIDGKQFYGGVMVFKKDESPQSILKSSPNGVAYTLGATAGEVCAKAATGGKAAIGGMVDFKAAADAVNMGMASAAFVKDFWWDDNKIKYPKLDFYRVPGVSEPKNPDNVVVASKSVPPELKTKLMVAAFSSPEIFGVEVIVPFDSSFLEFTLDLMKKGGIDPQTYSWPE